MYFALFMVIILLVTGVIWLLDIVILKKQRGSQEEPWYVEYSKSFFPVILLVFLIRSFLVEPFKIPSGSMMPTLLAGDYILVNKYTYGLRVPILNHTFYPMGHPERGDVFVFHYPPNPTIDYIKRVIGLPGDVIRYQDKQLTINGNVIKQAYLDDYVYSIQIPSDSGENREIVLRTNRLVEDLGSVQHEILVQSNENQYDIDTLGEKFQRGEEVTVPDGHYFAMGDNRDNSSDSRVWGFVPERNLVGKAFYIWFNFDNLGRIGNTIR